MGLNQYTTLREILNTQATGGFSFKKDLDNSVVCGVFFLYEYYPRHASSSPPTPSALTVRACLLFFSGRHAAFLLSGGPSLGSKHEFL